MARTQINAVQIEDLSIKNLQIATDADIELSKLEKMPLAEDGSGSMSGDLNMGNNKITNVATPTADTDGANKAYVDSVATGLDVKESVRVATTANITLSGEQTIDGVAVVSGDRVLVKDQSAGEDNGIYVVASGAWSRATDADSDSEVNAGMFTFVEEGTANADTGFVLSTDNPITVGTTELEFTKFSTQGQLSAGDGIEINSNVIAVDLDSDPGLEFNGGDLRVKIKANGGVVRDADGLSVNVDDSSIEIDSGELSVKAGGITGTELASSVAGNGLAGGGGSALSVNVDDSTIEIATDTLQVKDGGIDENKIASSALGNGLTGGSGTVLSIELATNSGLQFNAGALEVKLKAGGGISKDSDGLYVSGASETRVVREEPTGTKNGVNTDFDVANTPSSGSEMVFLNGLLQNEGATDDYTISGTTITFNFAPDANDTILVTYWY